MRLFYFIRLYRGYGYGWAVAFYLACRRVRNA